MKVQLAVVVSLVGILVSGCGDPSSTGASKPAASLPSISGSTGGLNQVSALIAVAESLEPTAPTFEPSCDSDVPTGLISCEEANRIALANAGPASLPYSVDAIVTKHQSSPHVPVADV
jgi:hypothetical protein